MLLIGSVVHVNWLQAFLLGLLQGITEFLPVSSTAHMATAPQLCHMQDPGAAFSAVVQLGPIVAIVAYFRHDLARYAAGVLRSRSPFAIPATDVDARLGWYTLLGTLPLVVFGVLLESKIDRDFRSLYVIAGALILLGLIMWYAERVGRRNKSVEDLTLGESQSIGWAQVLALVPGASRSGVTITAGLLNGLDHEGAVRFSFLLSIPAITLAGVYKLLKVAKTTHIGAETAHYVFAAVVAGVIAYIIVRWFLGYMKEHDTRGFIIYRIALGIALIFLVRFGLVHPRPAESPQPQATVQTAAR